jgi:iron complex transport system substrate-binding protein
MGRRSWASALTVAVAAAAIGCGGSSDGEEATGAEQEAVPKRIVSLSPTATETLFTIGAGPRVVAVDEQSDYPQGVPRTKLSASQPNVEAIAGYRPDLVVVSDESPGDLAEGLGELGVEVLAEPPAEDFEEAYEQIRELGAATGRREQAERLATRLRSAIDKAFASAPSGRGLSVFHELGPDLYSAGSETFIGQVYERLGLRNVADRAAGKASTAYPQLSAEAVVSADPDLVVLADTECCGQTPTKVRARPGWDEVSAVRDGAVIAVDDDIASRWGPRVPQFIREVVRGLEAAREGSQ